MKPWICRWSLSAHTCGCEWADLPQAVRRSCLLGALSAWISCAFLLKSPHRKIDGKLLRVREGAAQQTAWESQGGNWVLVGWRSDVFGVIGGFLLRWFQASTASMGTGEHESPWSQALSGRSSCRCWSAELSCPTDTNAIFVQGMIKAKVATATAWHQPSAFIFYFFGLYFQMWRRAKGRGKWAFGYNQIWEAELYCFGRQLGPLSGVIAPVAPLPELAFFPSGWLGWKESSRRLQI